MTKTITGALAASIANEATTLAICVEIVREDYVTYRITNHDTDLIIDGETFDHTTPFVLSATSSSTALSVDNVDLILFADGVTFIRPEFENGLFKHAEVRILMVDYEDSEAGNMTIRKGWMGEMTITTNDVISITVSGLLKILDFEIGRVYQPTCDADLGDSRCKVPVEFSQKHSYLNAYSVGDWVHHYDTTLMTAFTLVNPSFETDTLIPPAGWTSSVANTWRAEAEGGAPDGSNVAYASDHGITPTVPGTADDGLETRLYQDLDLTTGPTTGQIDSGTYFTVMTVAQRLDIGIFDPVRIQLEFFDTAGTLLTNHDTGFYFLDDFDAWRERTVSANIPIGARTARLSLWSKKLDGVVFNNSADDVRMWYWDHSAGNPWSSRIHKAVRIVNYTDDNRKAVTNSSFEVDGLVANGNTDGVITGWTFPASTDWWQVVSTFTGLADVDGGLFLMGGDDSSGTQSTYELTQDFDLLVDWNLDAARIDLDKYVARFASFQGFGDTLSAWGYDIEIYDTAFSTLLATVSHAPATGAVGWLTVDNSFTIPSTARHVRLKLIAISPVASSDAQVAFDAARFYVFDSERPIDGDPGTGVGISGTVFNTTVGDFTVDGNVIWKSAASVVSYDQVASVDSRRQFQGSAIAGADGTFEQGVIWWLSGNNAGTKNIIRVWATATKTIRMYFDSLQDIQVSDKFLYIKPCHKRFEEDCQLVFDNVINFRGFPHLPGKITDQ